MLRTKLMAGLLLAVALGQGAGAQGIDEGDLEEWRAASEKTGSEKAMANAVQVSGIKALAVANDNPIPGGTFFSNEVKSKGITDQKNSGRCWLFTGLNVLRARMIADYDLGEFTLSQNYVFFYDQLEKANLFLQSVIDLRNEPMDDRKVEWLFKNPLSDGGQFTGISDLISKYGVCPSEVMKETAEANNTTVYSRLMKAKLREFGLKLRTMNDEGKDEKELENEKKNMLGEVYRILTVCLGTPPEKFTWTRTDSKGKPVDTKEYTPLSFYEEYIGKDLKGGYLMFMNDPSREYYKTYRIDLDRHVYDGEDWTFVNVPMEEIKSMAIESIKDSTALYMSCDVNKFYNAANGYSDPGNYDYGGVLGTTFDMDKKARIETFTSGSTHAMTLVAVDLDDKGEPRKWMVENSWGATKGYKGHIIMSDEWLEGYLFRLVVEKKYIPARLQQLAEEEPTLLPAWDPLYAGDE